MLCILSKVVHLLQRSCWQEVMSEVERGAILNKVFLKWCQMKMNSFSHIQFWVGNNLLFMFNFMMGVNLISTAFPCVAFVYTLSSALYAVNNRPHN